MDRIVLKSFGKINLGLDVVRRRTDGYHEVRMIMQTVGLCDTLTMRKTKGEKISMKCDLSSNQLLRRRKYDISLS